VIYRRDGTGTVGEPTPVKPQCVTNGLDPFSIQQFQKRDCSVLFPAGRDIVRPSMIDIEVDLTYHKWCLTLRRIVRCVLSARSSIS
jgi:hypothetical protein